LAQDACIRRLFSRGGQNYGQNILFALKMPKTYTVFFQKKSKNIWSILVAQGAASAPSCPPLRTPIAACKILLKLIIWGLSWADFWRVFWSRRPRSPRCKCLLHSWSYRLSSTSKGPEVILATNSEASWPPDFFLAFWSLRISAFVLQDKRKNNPTIEKIKNYPTILKVYELQHVSKI